jgi:hypothetical protein
MTFVGGEEGLEADIRRIHNLRASPAIRYGAVDYDAVSVDHDSVYAVARRVESQACVVLVNLSDVAVSTTCSLDLGLGAGVRLYDAWADTALEWQGSWTHEVELDPYQIVVITTSTEPNGDNR